MTGVQLVEVERAARMDAPSVGLEPPAMATLGIFPLCMNDNIQMSAGG